VPASARDKKALLAILEKAQLVYLLTLYPKKQVLGDEKDLERLQQGLTDMRAAATDLSKSFREEHSGVPWDELAKEPDTPDLSWRRAKRVAPGVLRELVPLLAGEPEAAFLLQPEAKTKKAATKKTARR
jgi:uncharacterized protein with HEPN domain